MTKLTRNPYLASGKTTLAGVLLLVALVLNVLAYAIDGNPETAPDWQGLVKGIADFIALAAGAGGFLAAKDADRSIAVARFQSFSHSRRARTG